MFLSPRSKSKLINARAGGGRVYYCKESGGRMVTLSMMKFFIGDHAARELFLRSKSDKTSMAGLSCPSCSKTMRRINSPRWTGSYDVEVCNRCHLFWIDEEQYPNIPNVDDMLVEGGDTTIISDTIKEQAKINLIKENKQNMEFLSEPDDMRGKIAGWLGLPVEIHDRDDPYGIIGKVIAVFLVLIYFWQTQTQSQILYHLGFYPDDIFRNSGINIFTAPVLHGSLMHLISNLYFFLIFANDVENHLGPVKFVFFLFGSMIIEALLMGMLSISEGVPHIGFSGVISAIMVYYALQFPKTKIGFVFPLFIYRVFDPKSGEAYPSFKLQWFRLPILLVFAWWIGKEIVLYIILEQMGDSNVSHSGHISGYLAGLFFWILFNKLMKKSYPLQKI